jgi:hypothetical protein
VTLTCSTEKENKEYNKTMLQLFLDILTFTTVALIYIRMCERRKTSLEKHDFECKKGESDTEKIKESTDTPDLNEEMKTSNE